MNSVAKKTDLLVATRRRPSPAAANPVTDSYQLCVGVIRKSCTSQQQARWAYIAKEHTMAAMANPQTVIPW